MKILPVYERSSNNDVEVTAKSSYVIYKNDMVMLEIGRTKSKKHCSTSNGRNITDRANKE